MTVQSQLLKGESGPSFPEERGVMAAASQGCDVHPVCLECPLPRCVYEVPGGEKGALRQKRNEEIRRLFHKGTGVEELAFAFKVSVRSIYRIVGSGNGRGEDSMRKQGVRQ